VLKGNRLKGERDGNVELVRGERSAGLLTGQAEPVPGVSHAPPAGLVSSAAPPLRISRPLRHRLQVGFEVVPKPNHVIGACLSPGVGAEPAPGARFAGVAHARVSQSPSPFDPGPEEAAGVSAASRKARTSVRSAIALEVGLPRP